MEGAQGMGPFVQEHRRLLVDPALAQQAVPLFARQLVQHGLQGPRLLEGKHPAHHEVAAEHGSHSKLLVRGGGEAQGRREPDDPIDVGARIGLGQLRKGLVQAFEPVGTPPAADRFQLQPDAEFRLDGGVRAIDLLADPVAPARRLRLVLGVGVRAHAEGADRRRGPGLGTDRRGAQALRVIALQVAGRLPASRGHGGADEQALGAPPGRHRPIKSEEPGRSKGVLPSSAWRSSPAGSRT